MKSINLRNKLYKKANDREVLNYGLSEKAINRKKVDLVKMIVAMLFDLRLGESNNGAIQTFRQIEKTVEKIALLNGVDLFMENKNIIDNSKQLIFEIDISGMIVNYASGKLLKIDLKRMGYRAYTANEASRLTNIAKSIMAMNKGLIVNGYNIKGPVKNILDNVYKIINTILTNER